MEVKFKVDQFGELNNKELDLFLKAYHKLYMRIYGKDFSDSLASLLNKRYYNSILKDYSENYRRANETINSIQNNPNFSLLKVYLENKLVGFAMLQRIDESEAIIPEIALYGISREDEIKLWTKVVKYVEEYFRSLGFEKMYIEIPFCEVMLLFEARDLGFVENPEDIIVNSDEQKTYLLNKELVREYNEKRNNHRK